MIINSIFFSFLKKSHKPNHECIFTTKKIQTFIKLPKTPSSLVSIPAILHPENPFIQPALDSDVFKHLLTKKKKFLKIKEEENTQKPKRDQHLVMAKKKTKKKTNLHFVPRASLVCEFFSTEIISSFFRSLGISPSWRIRQGD